MNTKISAGVVHELPEDVKDVLISAMDVRTVWEDITSLARNEWICWIISAKKIETRNKRIKQMCTDLIKGKRRPCCWPGCSHRSKKNQKISVQVKSSKVESKSSSTEEKSVSQQIDAIIKESDDWRGPMLSNLRTLIISADPGLVEEVKWKKPSKPEGVPVWSHEGILCYADTLKNTVRLTFPNGARIKDPKKLFNKRLESNTVRAIDFSEAETINDSALKSIIKEAVKLNTSKAGKRESLTT